MLKIWKGQELEGFEQQVDTLFICSNSYLDFNFIKKFIKDNSVNRVYLGAGRQRFKGFGNYKSDKKFVDFCKQNNIKLIIETEPNYLVDLLYFLNYAEIILTIRLNSFKINNIYDIKLKLDDYSTARIFNNNSFIDTDLSQVSDNRYSSDIILYEEV